MCISMYLDVQVGWLTCASIPRYFVKMHVYYTGELASAVEWAFDSIYICLHRILYCCCLMEYMLPDVHKANIRGG